MRSILYLLGLIWLFSYPAYAADNAVTVTNGSDINLKSKDVGSGVQLMQHNILDSASAEIFGLVTASPAANTIGARLVTLNTSLGTINTTLGSPFQAGGSIGNTSFAATQGTAANLNATVVGTGTFAVQAAATQSGTWNITNISGTISLPTGAATSANQTNAGQKTQIVDGSGNVIASTSNNLNVQCANCSGSGASAADEASFTAGSSTLAPSGGFFQTTATNNALTTGQQGMWQMTAQRAGFVNLRNASGVEIGTSSSVVYFDTPASGNLYTAVTGAIPAGTNIIGKFGIDQTTVGTTNGVSIAQIGSTTVDGNSGNKSAGTLRVVIATDQPQLTNKLLVTPDANSSVNLNQIAGNTTSTGNGVAGTGVQRVTVASDNTAFGVKVTDGTNTYVVNACQGVALTSTPISISSATTTRIVAPASSKKTYLCGLFIISAGTQNVGIVEGTGGTCGTGTAGVIGGTTAATGPNLTAQVGFVLPNTGYPQAITAGSNVDLCLITSAAVQISGVIVWAQL